MLSDVSVQMTRGQAEQLMPIIMSALDKAGTEVSDIARIAVTKGPGAFTGMRIGLATAKSLGLALNIPVYGVCTLQAILNSYRILETSGDDVDYYCVLLETKRKDYYMQLFDFDFHEVTDAKAISLGDVLQSLENKNALMIGDANSRFMQETGREAMPYHDCVMPLPLAIARLAMKISAPNSDPVYLRPPDVSLPKKPPRKIAQ